RVAADRVERHGPRLGVAERQHGRGVAGAAGRARPARELLQQGVVLEVPRERARRHSHQLVARGVALRQRGDRGVAGEFDRGLRLGGARRARHIVFDQFEALGGAARAERDGVEAVHGAWRACHLLAFEPAGGAGVPLERQRVASQAHDEGAALGGERRGREQRREHGDWRDASPSDHVTRIDFTSSFCAILFTTSMPLVTCPNTVWTPSRWRCGAWQMKNWLPPVSFPAWAMESVPATCLWTFLWVSHLIV